MGVVATAVVKIAADIGDFDKGLQKAQRQLLKTADQMEAFGRKMSVAVTLPIVALGAAAVRSAAQMDSLTRGLTAVSGSSAEAERQLTRLKEVAKLPGLGFREAIQGSINLQAAGFSARLAERALTGFGNALATVGKGKSDLDGVIMALGQIASKGKISAEEINQIAERVPQIRKVMQQAFGTSNTETLQKMNIDAATFVSKISEELNKLPKATGGAANSFENLSDAVFRLSAAFGKGLLPIVGPAIEKMARMAESVADMDANTRNLVLSIGMTAAAIGPLVMVSAMLTRAWVALQAAMMALMGGGFGALVRLLSPAGIVIAGLTALGFLIHKSGEAARQARVEMDAYAKALGNVEQASLRKQAAELQAAQNSLIAQRSGVAMQIGAMADARRSKPNSQNLGPEGQRWLALHAEQRRLDEQIKRLAGPLAATNAALTPLMTGGGGGGVGGSFATPGATLSQVFQQMKAVAEYGELFDRDLPGLARSRTVASPNIYAARVRTSLPGLQAMPITAQYTSIAPELSKMQQSLRAGFADVSAAIGQELASKLVFAIGGNGRGSQFGANLGGRFGESFFTKLVSIKSMGLAASAGLPLIGGLLGALGGGLFGSLFNHKKKTDDSAAALSKLATTTERVNAALNNLPSGFKIESYRYWASNVEGTGSLPPNIPSGPNGGTPGRPTRPGGTGAAASISIGSVTVLASSPTEFAREMNRVAEQEMARAGSSMALTFQPALA